MINNITSSPYSKESNIPAGIINIHVSNETNIYDSGCDEYLPDNKKMSNLMSGFLSGISLEKAASFIDFDYKQLWGFVPENGMASLPCYGPDKTVYFGDSDGKLHAVKDGQELWMIQTGARMEAAPCIGSDGTVYAGSDKLYAIKDGKKLWEYKPGGDRVSSPCIGADGTVYVGVKEDPKDVYMELAAIKDGKKLWGYKIEGGITTAPILGPDGTIYVIRYDGWLYAIKDGKKKWNCRTHGWGTHSPLLGPDGTIYVGVGPLSAIKDGKELWSLRLKGDDFLKPTLSSDGTFYAGTSNGNLYAIKDGKYLWKMESEMIGTSPVIGPGGVLYVGGHEGNFFAIKDGVKLKEFETGKNLHCEPHIYPDGTVIVGVIDGNSSNENYGRLYAFKIDAAAISPSDILDNENQKNNQNMEIEDADGYIIIGGIKIPKKQ